MEAKRKTVSNQQSIKSAIHKTNKAKKSFWEKIFCFEFNKDQKTNNQSEDPTKPDFEKIEFPEEPEYEDNTDSDLIEFGL